MVIRISTICIFGILRNGSSSYSAEVIRPLVSEALYITPTTPTTDRALIVIKFKFNLQTLGAWCKILKTIFKIFNYVHGSQIPLMVL